MKALMRPWALALLLCASSDALRLTVSRRVALGTAAVLAADASLGLRPANAAASKLLDAAGISIKEPVRDAGAGETSLNEAERKLAEVLAKTVKEKEVTLGFTLEAEDIADLEQILRSKYCGKQGVFSSLPGGSCQDAAPTATCFKGNSNMNSLGVKGGCKNS